MHVEDVFGMLADPAEKAKHALHEKWRLDQPLIGKVRQVVQMRDIVALELKPRPVSAAGRDNILDVGK